MKTEVCIKDLEQIARNSLDSAVFDFISGGSMDEITLNANESSYSKINLLPKILTGVSNPDTSINLLGNTLSMPILIAPMAFHKLIHPNGEDETARAANKAKTVMVISTFSTSSLETVTKELSLPPWFQTYILKDRGLTRAIIELAEHNDCNALVLTVDASIYGKRERELRNPLSMNINLPDLVMIKNRISPELSLNKASDFSTLLDPTICWEDIAWLKSITKLPIYIKGILRPDDACLAASHGVNGIIISNHGGRQLDTTPTAINMLPIVKAAVQDRLDIFVDGGIRRGADVLKALALGAKAVLVGRPILWGLAANGSTGVQYVLDCLNQELKHAMALSGCKTIHDINEDIILKNN